MNPPLKAPLLDESGALTLPWVKYYLSLAGGDESPLAAFSDPRPTQVSHLDNDAGYLDATATAAAVTAALAAIVDLDISGVYKVAGVQVVGPRAADPGVSALSPSAITGNTSRTAAATYAANEQAMLNELKTALAGSNTAIANLKTAIDALIIDRNNLRAIMQVHGLMA